MYMRKILLIIGMSLMAVVLAACSEPVQEETLPPEVDISDAEKVAADEIVAVVAGKEIYGEAYNQAYMQKKIAAEIEGDVSPDLEKLKEETIEMLIHNELILEMAINDGIVIEEAEIEESLVDLKRMAKEQYADLISEEGHTDESIAQLLRIEKTNKEYLDKHIMDQITVSDEEVEARYNEVKASAEAVDEEVPEFVDSEKQLRAMIRVDKAKVLMEEDIAAFRDTVEIEIKLE